MIKVIEFEHCLNSIWLGTFKKYLTSNMEELKEISTMYGGVKFEEVTNNIRALGSFGIDRMYISIDKNIIVVGTVDELEEYRE